VTLLRMKAPLAALCIGLLGIAGHCSATVTPPHIAAEVPAARLAGEGTYRWFGLKIYEAQLWVGSQGLPSLSPTAPIAPTTPSTPSFALDLQYARSFDGRKIAQKSIDEIENLGLGNDDQHHRWLVQMEACFPHVEEGTHLTGIYLPDSGVRYYRDGKWICEIKDKDFAAAFFAIWLDPHTSAKPLRDALLGKLHGPTQ
jgi:hypothetical protein